MKKVKIYKNITEGDFVVCNDCQELMLLPYGADQCPECYSGGTLDWADKENQEVSLDWLTEQGYELEYVDRDLRLEDYLEPDTIANDFPEYYETIHDPNY